MKTAIYLVGVLLTLGSWLVAQFHRITVLEKSMETMSYVMREQLKESPKGSPSGVNFSLWTTRAGKEYYFDKVDNCFYGVQENPAEHTYGYHPVPRWWLFEDDFFNCGERK